MVGKSETYLKMVGMENKVVNGNVKKRGINLEYDGKKMDITSMQTDSINPSSNKYQYVELNNKELSKLLKKPSQFIKTLNDNSLPLLKKQKKTKRKRKQKRKSKMMKTLKKKLNKWIK